MAPEYAMEGRFSDRSDVYSFGVLVLEIIKGKRNTHYYNHEQSLSLLGCVSVSLNSHNLFIKMINYFIKTRVIRRVSQAWMLWSEGNGLSLGDESIARPEFEEEMVRCIHIALLCVQDYPKDRPTIETVVSMLRREIVDLPAPKQPVLAEKWNASTEAGTRAGYSMNELTLTALQGR